MAIRNFWLEANIDGRRTALTGGPQAKDGGFDLDIYIRNNGSIEKAAVIQGYAHDDGRLELRIVPTNAKTDAQTFVESDGRITIRRQR